MAGVLHVLIQPWNSMLNKRLRQLFELFEAAWTHKLEDVEISEEHGRIHSVLVDYL